MKPRALLISLAGAGLLQSATAFAADDFCSRLALQMVQQICQYLPNGLTVCQPVAVMTPPAECATEGKPAVVHVPLAPPSLNPFGAYLPAMTPAASQPVVPALPALMAQENPPIAAVPGAVPSAAPVAPLAVVAPPVSETKVAPEAAQPVVQAPAASVPPLAAVAPPVSETKVAPEAAQPVVQVPATPVPPLAVVATPVSESKAVPEAAQPVVQAPAASVPPLAAVTPPVSETKAAPEAAQPVVQAPAAPVPPLAAVAPPVSETKAAPEAVQPIIHEPAAPVEPFGVITSTDSPAKPTRPEHYDALAHFDFDSAELTAVGRAALDTWLAKAEKDQILRVSGHADRLGPEPYNLKLSLQRAESVKKYLTEKGVNPRRVQLEAKGESDPVKQCKGGSNPKTKACLAPNRRVRIDPE